MIQNLNNYVIIPFLIEEEKNVALIYSTNDNKALLINDENEIYLKKSLSNLLGINVVHIQPVDKKKFNRTYFNFLKELGFDSISFYGILFYGKKSKKLSNLINALSVIFVGFVLLLLFNFKYYTPIFFTLITVFVAITLCYIAREKTLLKGESAYFENKKAEKHYNIFLDDISIEERRNILLKYYSERVVKDYDNYGKKV